MQGTLYGQGSSGGVFIFHTRDPDLKEFRFIGEAEVGYWHELEGGYGGREPLD